jgi:predicted GIY-YIG superfamily endonuclease
MDSIGILCAVLIPLGIILLIIWIAPKIKRANIIAKREQVANELQQNSIKMSTEQFMEYRSQIKARKYRTYSYRKYNDLESKLDILRNNHTGVYVIHNQTSNQYYVGQSKNMTNRVFNHFNGKGNGDIYADYKYGKGIFDIELIRCELYELNDVESALIRKYNAHRLGYNKNKGITRGIN